MRRTLPAGNAMGLVEFMRRFPGNLPDPVLSQEGDPSIRRAHRVPSGDSNLPLLSRAGRWSARPDRSLFRVDDAALRCRWLAESSVYYAQLAARRQATAAFAKTGDSVGHFNKMSQYGALHRAGRPNERVPRFDRAG